MDATLRIKNLSIALEALSRVAGYTDMCNRIGILVSQEILQAEKETQWPQRGPAKPKSDDDIPF